MRSEIHILDAISISPGKLSSQKLTRKYNSIKSTGHNATPRALVVMILYNLHPLVSYKTGITFPKMIVVLTGHPSHIGG
jgi:hypothetical protein